MFSLRFKTFQLPESLEGKIGGVTFGDNRDFISAPLAVLDGGPYDMYEEYWAVFLKAQLKDADGEGAFVGGRKDSGLRERLDRSIEGDGIRNLLEGVELDERRLVHPDFSKFHHFSNALPCLPVQWMPLAGTDTETLDLTALLDLDFAYTSHPADEFLRSLSTNFGDVPSPNTCKAPHNEPPAELDRAALLCRFLLHGFPSSDLLPPEDPIQPDIILFPIAATWDEELEKRNMLRPQTIQGMDKPSELWWLGDKVAPFFLVHELMVKRIEKEDGRGRLEEMKSEARGELERFLDAWGF